jgi:carbon starvation protein
MNSFWLVITALAAFLVAYRFYGAFLAAKVAVLDDSNVTPAHRLRDDVDYQPTRRLVLFGVHFAAIAGSGPLVGPVLASQWGYFPGFCWIVIGSCLAGGVHDFIVLLASVRHDGKSLPQIARELLGPVVGITTTVATLLIIAATLAATGKVVVNALNESAWGMFTIIVTIPAALLTGFWMNKIRPGRIGEASLIGVTLVVLGVIFGQTFDNSAYRGYLLFSTNQLAMMLPIYAAVVSILPVWVLMCPRDYLSSYMKVGVILMLGVGILVAQPLLKMPATTPFIHGDGPIPGNVWPFVCIVIACGALSGFHALIASGTTPKMINKESDMRLVGYGAMLMEGFVSLTALIAACSLEPGDYFKINTEKVRYEQLVREAKEKYQWDLRPLEFNQLKKDAGVKEDLSGRTAGAVTLALGMAKVLANLPGMRALTAYLYHFVIMFEALFILTLLETGTRVARFILQDLLAPLRGKHAAHEPSWALNVITSVLVCGVWGYLLYKFEIGRLWLMMGIANQLLATIGLAIGTTYLLQHAPKRVYALCTGIPFVVVAVTVFTAGIESLQLWWGRLSLPGLADADVFSYRLMCALVCVILLLGALIVIETVRRWCVLLAHGAARAEPQPAPGKSA